MDGVWRWSSRWADSSILLAVLVVVAVGAAIVAPVVTHPPSPTAAKQVAVQMPAPTDSPTTAASAPSGTAPTSTVPTSVANPATTTPPSPPTPSTAPPPTAPPPVPDAHANVVSSASGSGYGCPSAIAYLDAHAAPGFAIECPGYAEGHQAMTCDHVAGVCPDTKVIAISTPCPAAYMNEASNSWVISGESKAPIDPYGYCH